MAHEAGPIARWLTDRLTRDEELNRLGFGTGEVYRTSATSGAPTPYIVFSFQSGGNDDNNAGARNLTEPVVLVKIISRDNQSMDAHEDALNRIDDLLQSVQVQTEGFLLFCEGDNLFEQIEAATDNSILYHQGRYWHFYITKLGE